MKLKVKEAWEQLNKRAVGHRKTHSFRSSTCQQLTQAPYTKYIVIHGKKKSRLLTCTIKASFAKRKDCFPLALS